MDIAVELTRIVIVDTSPKQIIFLREADGERSFPIQIGISEALAIDRRWKGVDLPRPMTHDLLANVIADLGGRIERIVIHDLRDATFMAKLVISRDGEIIEVDARPSDAIALGAAYGTPIFVASHVFDEVTDENAALASQLSSLETRRDQLLEMIGAIRQQLAAGAPDVEQNQLGNLRARLSEMQAELEAIEEILRQVP